MMLGLRNKEDLQTMYDEIQEVNDILCLPSKYWTEEQRALVGKHLNQHSDPYYYPSEADLECQHNYETRYLFTSTYRICKLCGEEEPNEKR